MVEVNKKQEGDWNKKNKESEMKRLKPTDRPTHHQQPNTKYGNIQLQKMDDDGMTNQFYVHNIHLLKEE